MVVCAAARGARLRRGAEILMLDAQTRLVAASRRLVLMRAIGERLITLRSQAGLSRDELAGRARLPPSLVPKAERGEVDLRLSQIVAFAEGLGVSPAQLVAELPSGASPAEANCPGSAQRLRPQTAGSY